MNDDNTYSRLPVRVTHISGHCSVWSAMHCQRNRAPYPDLSGHVAKILFFSLASKAIFPTYNYLNIIPSHGPLALEDLLKFLLK